MAQKAAKQQAAKNAARLNQTHLTTLFVHSFYLLFRTLLYRRTFTTRSLTLYILFSLPALFIEFWLEKIARPVYKATDAYGDRELVKAGEDLDASGVTEYCWDIVYWTWGVVGLASAFGDWMWSLWVVVPLYTLWSVYGAYSGARKGMGGLMGGGSEAEGQARASASGVSKRQQKLEKRGGQKMQYR